MDTLVGFEEVDGIELFQRLPHFRALTFDETRRLAAIAHPESRGRGEVLVEEGALGRALCIIKAGTVVVTRSGQGTAAGAEGRSSPEVSLGRLGPGELFGEMSLVDDELTSATVTALENVELLVIPKAAFDDLVRSEQGLALKIYQAFCRTLCARLRRANPQLSQDAAMKAGVY